MTTRSRCLARATFRHSGNKATAVTGFDWRHFRERFTLPVTSALAEGCRASLDLLFPHVCVLCNEALPEPHSGPAFCSVCQDELAAFDDRVCRRCGSPLPKMAFDDNACAACRKRRYHFDVAIAYGLYRGSLRSSVLKAKRAAHEPLATALGELLWRKCAQCWTRGSFDLLVPMPMHWHRRWRRGSNSAELLAEAVAKKWRLPVSRALVLRRATSKQGTLAPRERFENVRGAFRTARGVNLRRRRVLLIDDVMTTGATASEAARALKQAGAATVCVAVVARGIGQ